MMDTYKEFINGMERDIRPQKGMWAPGFYLITCHECGDKFLGDKRAMICSDCAYKPET